MWILYSLTVAAIAIECVYSQDFICPTSEGFYPHPVDCDKYYQCANTRSTLFQCQEGTYWSETNLVCSWRHDVSGCDDNGKRLHSAVNTQDKTSHRDVKATSTQLKEDIGKTTVVRNQDMKAGAKVQQTTLPFTSTDEVATDSIFSTTSQNDLLATTTLAYAADSSVTFDCPKDYGYYPDLNDCSYYFECILGNPYRRQCMHGTLFDRVRHKCTWENLVRDCASLTPSSKNVTPKVSNTKAFKCPKDDGYFRNPGTCRSYFHCIDGNPIFLECDSGSVFDQYIGKCTWSGMVSDCDLNGNPIDSSTSSPQSDLKEKKENAQQSLSKIPVLNEGTISYRSFKCPKEDGYFRDPDNCAVYFFCTKWKVYQHQCKPGTVFSMEKFTCTWPKLVSGCDTNKTQTVQTTEEGNTNNQANIHRSDIWQKEPIAQTNQPGEVIKQHGEKLPEMNSITEAASISFVCPPVFDGFYGDPISCSRFYRCIGGKMYTFSCPQGTFFDNLRFLCNFVSEVTDCTPNGIRNTMIIQNDEFGESSFDLPPPGFNDVSSTCPKSDGVFAHPTSCKQFVYCSKFVPQIFECPRDLIYNIQIHSCDYPDNAICKLYD